MSDLRPILPDDTVAVVLAGGFGTRLSRVLKDVPKPMAIAAGKPFLEWIVRFLVTSGLRRVVLSTGHLAHVVQNHFRDHPIPNLEICCVLEDRPLGTGGAFLHSVAHCRWNPAAWLVCNGDSLILEPLQGLFTEINAHDIDAAIIGRQMRQAGRFGSLKVGADGTLESFEEKKSSSTSAIINAGVYLFKHQIIGQFPFKTPLSFEYDVMKALLAQGSRIRVLPSSGHFIDIGTEETLPQASAFISTHGEWFGT